MNKLFIRFIPIIISAFIVQCDIIPFEDAQTDPPVACFDTDKSIYNVGETVYFTNCSQNAEQYGWLFNQKNVTENSTDIEPRYNYDAPGTYTISLTAFNGQLNDIYEKTIEVTEDSSPEFVNVTFVVNMAVQIALGNFDPTNDFVELQSSLNDWGSFENTIYLLDNDGDDVYEVTLSDIEVGTFVEYKFSINSNGDEITEPDIENRTYTVKTSGNKLEHIFNDETEIPVNPADYFGIPAWGIYFYDDFETPGGWEGIAIPEVSSIIENGVYKVTIGELTFHWATFPTDIKMPSESENFDIEMRFRFTQNNQSFGDIRGTSLIWAVDTTEWFHNWYHVDPLGAYLIQSNYASASWMGGEFLSGGNAMSELNLLTVRKFEDRYYFFLNETFLFDVPFDSYAGQMFGFKVGPNYSVEVEDYGIFLMELSNKSGKKTKKQLLLNNN